MSFWGVRKGFKRRQSDSLFSVLVRIKRGYRCEKCGKKHDTSSMNIGLSHFKGRSRESVRYDEENVDVLCNIPCHNYFEEHKKDYEKWKEERMGTKAYKLLLVRSEQTGRYDPFVEKILCKRFREEMKLLTN